MKRLANLQVYLSKRVYEAVDLTCTARVARKPLARAVIRFESIAWEHIWGPVDDRTLPPRSHH